MIIRANLFNNGHPLTRQPGLSSLLEAQRQRVVGKIKAIPVLEKMTEPFLSALVKDSLVQPLALHFDRMSRQPRTEMIPASMFPDTFHVEPGHSYPKTVVRVSIPFSGESKLLEYCPSTCSTTFPQGEVSGNAIQFDVILLGHHDEGERVKEQVGRNLRMLESCAENVNKDVKTFNEGLPALVKGAFSVKLEELTKQLSIFEELGIKEEKAVPTTSPSSSPRAPSPKKAPPRVTQIIQHIETMYVEQLSQTNYNAGDVNNAIQAGG
jgi:hypothetical protein